ncbi:SDR family NAD(P)-dependent oxidoreductase [Pigmentiphaga kullae]|uniref:Meso-butanediol dehydrogenase/(S,S)-butanediol dehydrogenase/diacetyl reductase n=1 Tax=Pigmentiphaga kullae TaxID=151784 RepID=A0A4Q7N6X7_9BURK|nr:SDR family oxidoreductase [Pigmentiphaga kullae]RZS77114.1 meso-butanediol dehydrogenase/(S,S)-butanediol dehydrogenase/diacetyl reductase [Pigmentiphaga kullae]
MARLAERRTLITGGAAGIGAAIARVFCQEGAAVLLVDRDADALARTAAALREQHPRARIESMAADVADEEAAPGAAALARRAWGGLDVLVCNAAMRNYSPLSEARPEEWRAMVDVNLVGTANYCRAALPALRESGKGSLVIVSSCYAVTGRAGMGIYDATKAGLLAMTRTLAFEEAPHGVRVNAVCPGSTLTEFHVGRARARGKAVEQLKGERSDTSLLGRWAAPEEIAWPVLWLASDEASFMTGTHVLVDGGLSAM